MLTENAPTSPGRQEFLGLGFDTLSGPILLEHLKRVTSASRCSYVVTPNVDHVVRLAAPRQRADADREVEQAYDGASWCVCDSRVLAMLAKSCGISLPVIPGSDLTAKLFEQVVGPGDTVAVVGASEDVVGSLRALFPAVVIRHHQPPMGLRHNEDAMERAVRFAVQSGARFTFLAVGSPQQELLAKRIASEPDARGCVLCIGAAIEFVSGRRSRAPRLFQKLGLEWSYRLAQDPRRLWRRYLVEGPRILLLVRDWRRARKPGCR